MKRYATILIALLACVTAHALTVRVDRPGTLRDVVADPAAVAQLTVSGTVDASDFAFMAYEMTSLTALDLGAATIAAYEGEPLQGMRSFAAATLPQHLLSGTRLENVTLPSTLRAIGDCALAGTRLGAVTVPASVQSIGSGAFAGCTALRTADVKAATLGPGAFAGCTALTSVSLPEGVAIADRCFAGDTSLATVDAPGLTAIGERAFAGCTSLEAQDFGTSLTSVGAYAFAGSGLVRAEMGGCRRLSSVGPGAFAGCAELEVLSLPEGADVADAHALAMGCPRLQAVELPSGAVPDYALSGAVMADASGVVAGASQLGDYALKGVAATAELALPRTLEYIGDHAMEGMSGLQRIDATALAEVPALGDDVWHGVEQPSVRLVPSDEMLEAFRAADQWKDFDVRSMSSTGNVLKEFDGHMRAAFSGSLLLVECTLAGVESIVVADTEGRVLATLVPDGDGRAALDTSRLTTRIYLLATSGSTKATIKIARNF